VTVPAIPAGVVELRPDRPPRVVRMAGRDLVLGQARALAPGAEILVRRWGRRKHDRMTRVRIGRPVYATTVPHRARHGGLTIRYVVAEYTEITD
jgi:hypothetical protein